MILSANRPISNQGTTDEGTATLSLVAIRKFDSNENNVADHRTSKNVSYIKLTDMFICQTIVRDEKKLVF